MCTDNGSTKELGSIEIYLVNKDKMMSVKQTVIFTINSDFDLYFFLMDITYVFSCW
jgi:hypothetical protein